jgi:hypothetical protein
VWEQDRLDDYRRRAIAFAPVPRDEQFVDAALADSFPASDAPPWTLGVNHRARAVRSREGIVHASDARPGHPTWWDGFTALFEAALVVLFFALGILVVGSAVALAVRLFVAALTATASGVFSLTG